jgi:hypothetical protein
MALNLETLFIVIGQAFLAVVIPFLTLCTTAFAQRGTVNATPVMGHQPPLFIRDPFLGLGIDVALAHHHAVTGHVQAKVIGRPVGASALGFLDYPVPLLLHGLERFRIEFNRLRAGRQQGRHPSK